VDGYRTGLRVKPSVTLTTNIMKELLAQCAESLVRRNMKEAAIASNAGYDAEDRETAAEQLEEEVELLTSLTDALGQLIKVHGEGFMPMFDAVIAPAFSAYLADDHPAALQIIAVCLVDDAIEFGGEPALKYVPTLLVTLMGKLASTDNVLRQCSVYGIARAAYSAPEQVKQQLNSTLHCLLGVVNSPTADHEENEGATENAVFALGTIATELVYRDAIAPAGVISVAQLGSLWLERLPLGADEKEAKTASRQLCDALERGDVAITGEGYSNLKDILRVIAMVLESAAQNSAATVNSTQIAIDESLPTLLAHPQTIQRMKVILKHLSSSAAGISSQQLQEAYSDLTPELQTVLSESSAL
jgi:hypothetical protein